MSAVRTSYRRVSLALATVFLTMSLSHAREETVFEDCFDHHLADGWSWIRQQPARWCVRDGALEIRLMPGDAKTVENALVRKAPDRRAGPLAIEVTVTALSEPVQQYEQAGA